MVSFSWVEIWMWVLLLWTLEATTEAAETHLEVVAVVGRKDARRAVVFLYPSLRRRQTASEGTS